MLQIALGGSLAAIKGLAAPEAGKAYARALELCRQVGETSQTFPVLGGLAHFYIGRGELRTTREVAEQLLRLAKTFQSAADLQFAHFTMGTVLFSFGEFPQSQTHLEQAIALYDPQKPRSLAPFDPGVACLGVAARTLWALGYPDQALGRIRESLILAQERSHSFSQAFVFYITAEHHYLRREAEASQEQAEALIALSNEQGFALWEGLGVTFQGWALAKQGRKEEGIARIGQGLSVTQAAGGGLWQPHFLALLAEASGEAGQPGIGLTMLTQALDLASKTGERRWEVERYRLKGELLLMQDQSNTAQAESCFQRAIEIARDQRARSWELRATTSLTRLLERHGRRKEAHSMLSEIYAWFTEGFDTADLKEAQTLLEELK
jgi:predicted ATPase